MHRRGTRHLEEHLTNARVIWPITRYKGTFIYLNYLINGVFNRYNLLEKTKSLAFVVEDLDGENPMDRLCRGFIRQC